jgi:hypothetical protein
VTALKQTTVSYPEWVRRLAQGRYPGGPLSTKWGQAFDLLARIGTVSPPPPSGPVSLSALHASGASGSTVVVPSGAHGNQRFALNKPMVFRASPGATLGDVSFAAGSGGVTLEGFTVGRVDVGMESGTPATDITLRDLDGVRFKIGNAQRVRVKGGDWGPLHNEEPSIVAWWDSNSRIPTDIEIADAYFHDITMVSGGVHVEGILIYAGNGIAVRRCRFARCGGTGDIGLFFLHLPSPNPIICNVLVEDCLGSVEGVDQGYAWFNLQVDRELLATQNVTLRRNTWPKKPNNPAERGPEGEFLTSWPGGNRTVLPAPPGWSL